MANETDPIPETEVPLGFEPVVSCGRDEADAHAKADEQREAKREALVARNRHGVLTVWIRTHRDWPIQ